MPKTNLTPNEQAANMQLTICKLCNTEKARIVAGKYPSGKDTRFVDITNKEWNGLQCPKCHADEVAIKQKIRRAKNKVFREKVNAKRRERYRRTGK